VCGIRRCSDMANRHSWVAWETSLAVQHSCHIWTQIILVIRQRSEKYSHYIMVQWTGHTATVYQQQALPSVCMQSNSVAVRLYTGNESNVCDDCAVLADKNCNWQQWCFEILDKVDDTALASSFKITFLYCLTTDWEARGNWLQVAQHLLYQVQGRPDCTVQC